MALANVTGPGGQPRSDISSSRLTASDLEFRFSFESRGQNVGDDYLWSFLSSLVWSDFSLILFECLTDFTTWIFTHSCFRDSAIITPDLINLVLRFDLVRLNPTKL